MNPSVDMMADSPLFDLIRVVYSRKNDEMQAPSIARIAEIAKSKAIPICNFGNAVILTIHLTALTTTYQWSCGLPGHDALAVLLPVCIRTQCAVSACRLR